MATEIEDILERVRALLLPEQMNVLQALARSLNASLAPLGDASANFWASRSIDDLEAEHHLPPVVSLDDLALSAWPDDESADDVIAYVRAERGRAR